MLRGCLFALLLYAAIVVGYFYWLDTLFERPQSIYGALGVGFVVFCCLGALLNARTALKDWSLLAAAGRGTPHRDGKPIAATGTIHPVGQPLIGPFSGEECVICEYDLSRHGRQTNTQDQENTGSDFAGFLMVPSVIRSPQGEMRLLGFPIVEGYSERVCGTYAAARRAIDFLTTREFETRTGVKIVTALSVFEDVWSDDDGQVERNIRLGTVSLPDLFPPELEAAIDRQLALDADAGPGSREVFDDEELEEDLEEEVEDEIKDEDENENERHNDSSGYVPPPKIPRMTEKRIDVGDEVCVIGTYNEMRRGLLPAARGRQANRLFRGSAEEVMKACRSKLVSHLIGGLVVLAIANAAVFGVMAAYRNSDELTRHRQKASLEAIEKNDIPRLEGLVRRGMNVNLRQPGGVPLLSKADKPELVKWLLDHGADVNAADEKGITPLMEAARGGRTEILEQLIAAKAELDRRSSEYDSTALMFAVSHGKEAAAEILRRAGAKDDVITPESGDPLPADGGELLAICKEYLAAVHARDAATLTRLFRSGPGIDFVDTDWELWHRTRPVEIESWTGFVREDDATVTIQGIGGAGYPCKCIYQLRREAGGWRIVREEVPL
jgi:hypothetical protein